MTTIKWHHFLCKIRINDFLKRAKDEDIHQLIRILEVGLKELDRAVRFWVFFLFFLSGNDFYFLLSFQFLKDTVRTIKYENLGTI